MTYEPDVIASLLRLKSAFLTAALEASAKRFADALKYSPDQPRAPSGSPEGGQWTSGGDSGNENDDALTSFAVAARRGRSEAFCWSQLTIDLLLCNSVTPAWRYVVCRSQAMERYAACIAGRPLPPLSY